jgi:bifunctional pyridoxal-dependent enzyme with beta-cystathionase and maltose regulon repressor activities
MALGYPNRKSDSYYEKTAGYSNGELDWNYQKDAAKVRSSTLGITGITNNINVITSSKDVNKRIN